MPVDDFGAAALTGLDEGEYLALSTGQILGLRRRSKRQEDYQISSGTSGFGPVSSDLQVFINTTTLSLIHAHVCHPHNLKTNISPIKHHSKLEK